MALYARSSGPLQDTMEGPISIPGRGDSGIDGDGGEGFGIPREDVSGEARPRAAARLQARHRAEPQPQPQPQSISRYWRLEQDSTACIKTERERSL